jgi:hypothetical protein
MIVLNFCKEKARASVQTRRITKTKTRPSSYVQTCLQKVNGTEASCVASRLTEDWLTSVAKSVLKD